MDEKRKDLQAAIRELEAQPMTFRFGQFVRDATLAIVLVGGGAVWFWLCKELVQLMFPLLGLQRYTVLMLLPIGITYWYICRGVARTVKRIKEGESTDDSW